MSKVIGSDHDFYDWVRGRDPSELYSYNNACDCAVARYCRERGVVYHPMKYLNLEHFAQQGLDDLHNPHAPLLDMRGLREYMRTEFLSSKLTNYRLLQTL